MSAPIYISTLIRQIDHCRYTVSYLGGAEVSRVLRMHHATVRALGSASEKYTQFLTLRLAFCERRYLISSACAVLSSILAHQAGDIHPWKMSKWSGKSARSSAVSLDQRHFSTFSRTLQKWGVSVEATSSTAARARSFC